MAESGNLEAVARLRHHWLQEVAAESNCRWLVTGHADQAEVCSPPAPRQRPARAPRHRPTQGLNPHSRSCAFLASCRRDSRISRCGGRTCTDRTNLDRAFTRNRIRHELLPLLASEYNPDIARLLAQVAAQAEEAFTRTEHLADELRTRAERPRAGALLVFDRVTLADAPRDLVREMFRLVWLREGWPESDMCFDAWDRLAGVARGETTAADLPGGIRARALARVVQLGPC